MLPAVVVGAVTVGVVAVVALLLGPLVSWIIKRRSRAKAREEGAIGDPPGSPDRGPEGIKM